MKFPVKKRVHRVPSGTMPKTELNMIGKAANPEMGHIAKKDAVSTRDYPGDQLVLGSCNYDPRITLRQKEKRERNDPDYLGELFHFAHDDGNGNLVLFKTSTPIGKIKVVGFTYMRNPMTEEWVKAETVEIRLNVGGIVPATRLSKTHVIVQDFRFKAFVPTGWQKLKLAMQAVAATEM